jgi:predicted histidine transporter YuiF (NhaC family)
MQDFYSRKVKEYQDKIAVTEQKLTAGLSAYRKAKRLIVSTCGLFILVTGWLYVTKQYDAVIALYTMVVVGLTGVVIWRTMNQEITQSLTFDELQGVHMVLEEIRELIRLNVPNQ